MSAQVTITAVERHANHGLVEAFGLDRPKLGESFDGYHLTIAGWILAKYGRITSIQILLGSTVIKTAVLDVARDDVMQVHSGREQQRECGYVTDVALLGVPQQFALTIAAVSERRGSGEDSVAVVATVRGTHAAVACGYVPRYQPLLVTGLGRSGSTWLMHLLAGHPDILASPSYPYEVRIAGYWLQALRVLSSPADFDASIRPDAFEERVGTVGHNPFWHHQFLDSLPSAREFETLWGQRQVELLAAVCQQCIDAYYEVLERALGRTGARLFAEKALVSPVPWVAWNIYAGTREIFLVRDFRDSFCSARAFYRGRDPDASSGVLEDEQWLQRRRQRALRLAEDWSRRRDTALLVKYEDLVRKPRQTMSRILEYLELPCSESVLDQVFDRTANAVMLDQHRTSRDPVASIGRWRTDLEPETRELCQAHFHDLLATFNYD
jgi:hypothetical protein